MKKYTYTDLFERVPLFCVRHRRKVLTIFILLTLLMGLGISRLKVDMTMESFFLENDPVKTTYHHFRQLFGSDEYIFLIYRAKDGDVFSEKSLAALRTIHQRLDNSTEGDPPDLASFFKHIVDVESLFDISYMEADQDTLRSRKFLADVWPKDQAARAKLKAAALAHPSYVPTLLNGRADFSALIIETDLGAVASGTVDVDQVLSGAGFDETSETAQPDADTFVRTEIWEYQDIVNALNKILAASPAAQSLEFHPVGNPVVMKFFADVFTIEVNRLTILSISLIVLTLFLLLRSGRAVVGTVSIVVAALIWTLGIAGWLGITMTLMVTVLIFLTLSVGVADAVHILSGYMYLRHQGHNGLEALKQVFRTSGPACFLTSLTTAIGLMALVVVPVTPLQIFGLMAAVGVFGAFVCTMIVLPTLMNKTLFEKNIAKAVGKKPFVERLMTKLERWVYKWPLGISIVFLVIAAIFAYGMTLIRVDTNMVQIITRDHPVRQDVEIAEKNMGGTQNMEILVDAGAIDGLKDPRLLLAMEALQKYLEQQHAQFVVSTYSLVDAVKESFKALNEDQPAMYRIPATKPMLAQTLLLFESAAAEDRQDLVTDDYMQGRISVRIRSKGSQEYEAFYRAVQMEVARLAGQLNNDYPAFKMDITGNFALTMNLASLVSWSQIKSFSLALGVISFVFIFVFRSVKGGLLSIIPNLFPILVAFGLMGFLDFALDIDTLLVAPITIGIAVDDTIHFLSRYRMEMMRHGDIQMAVRETFHEVGQAMIFTSLILSAGFLIFFLSDHSGLQHFGLLSAAAIFAAVIADLFFLPRLCILSRLTFKPSR